MIVPLVNLPAIADAAVSGLSPAFDRSYVQTASDWLERCKQDLAQLWHDGDLWAVTEVQQGKDGRVLHIVAMAGDYSADMVTHIEQWGRAMGCVRVMFTGRVGWAKRRPDYKPKTITFEKELT